MSDPNTLSRRHFLGSSVAALGVTGEALKASADETVSPAQPASAASTEATEVNPSGMPYGKIGNVKFSRLIVGANIASGPMHSRDLGYVPQLARAYVTEEKIFETFKMCEENGINTVFLQASEFVHRYNKERGGHMQFISGLDVGGPEQELKDCVKRMMDAGIVATLVGVDRAVRAGQTAAVARGVEIAKACGILVGVGGHTLRGVMECEKAQVPRDFLVTTLHSDNYPSAIPKELRHEDIVSDGGKGWYDNMWCIYPEKTIAFMKTVRKPWIAFKVLAAGAIHPREGFPYAFRNGADFIAVGMFDFQVKENCTLLKRTVKHVKDRERPWCA